MIELGTRTPQGFTYDDAVLYCFCLGNGWRLPTTNEVDRLTGNEHLFLACWAIDRRPPSDDLKRYVLPVREVNDA